jgi:RNA polymerase sigma-70 factor (ECF subfamily)
VFAQPRIRQIFMPPVRPLAGLTDRWDPCDAARTMPGGGPPRPPTTLAEAGLAQYAGALRAAARALCPNPAEREDLVQDTFERALRHLARGNEPVRNARAWLVTILRNAFIDRMRVVRSMPLDDEDLPAPDPEPQPAWADVTLVDVRAALAEIDPDLRAVFELHYLEGMRYREIAARLSVPENTVASRLFRARKAVRAQLLASRGEETQE